MVPVSPWLWPITSVRIAGRRDYCHPRPKSSVRSADFWVAAAIPPFGLRPHSGIAALLHFGVEVGLFIEPIYAWKHGPVIRSLYDEFKHYKAGAIDKFSMTYDMDSHASDYPRIPNKEKDVILVLDKVWEIYKDFKAVTLREKTHEEGTPWRETYKQGEGAGRVINDELIRSHFESKITEYLENARQLN